MNSRGIQDFEFSWRDLTSVNIPEGVTAIGFGAFRCCLNLTSVNIPKSVTIIGDSAFEKCLNLTSINISTSGPSIDIYPRVIQGCDKLALINGIDVSGLTYYGKQAILHLLNGSIKLSELRDELFLDDVSAERVKEAVIARINGQFSKCNLEDPRVKDALNGKKNGAISYISERQKLLRLSGTDLLLHEIDVYKF